MSVQDSQTIQRPLDDSDNGPGMVIASAILGFVSTVIVLLRFLGKRLSRQPIGLDDYLCVAALIMQHVLLVSGCISVVEGGLGRDIRLVTAEDPNSVVTLYKVVLIAEMAYSYSSPLIKLSVLAFYWRIFPTPTVKLGCRIIGAMCIAWCISTTVLGLAQCRPLKAFWHRELQLIPSTHCIDHILSYLANGIANTVIDLFTLTLPIHEVLKLRIATGRKVKICSIFALGGLTLAASLVRTISLGALWKEGVTNFTKQFVVAGSATVVEPYVAIIGACLPMMLPIYRRLRSRDVREIHNGAPPKQKLPISIKPGDTGLGSFNRLSNSEEGIVLAANNSSYRVDISAGGRHDTGSYPPRGVRVTHDTVWSEDSVDISTA